MHNIKTTIKRFLSQLADLIRPLSLSRAAVSKLLGHIRRILSTECQSLADRLATVKALVMRLVEKLGTRRTKAARTAKTNVPAADKVSAQAVALREFVLSTYRLRYNTLAETTEVCRAEDGVFQPLTRRLLNTIVLEAQNKGIYCWDRDVQRILMSELVEDVHPIRAYIDALPEWDGVDRLTPLAQRVSHDGVWVMGFARWMTAMVAQWMGQMGRTANALAPILVSREQGMNKSTFCRMLMPPELRDYYLDRFDLTSLAQQERKMSLFGLINMDEFDRYDKRQMPTLKMLMQEVQPTMRRAYSQQWSVLPRIASFIGTSNQRELLRDETGSRRFLCVEVTAPLDCSPIDYAQLYAQLRHRVQSGERTFLTAEEEREVEARNAAFQVLRPEAEVFLRYYEAADGNENEDEDENKDEDDNEDRGEKPVERLSATSIYLDLRDRCPAVMRTCAVQTFARTLLSLGVRRVHQHDGNVYLVRRRV